MNLTKISVVKPNLYAGPMRGGASTLQGLTEIDRVQDNKQLYIKLYNIWIM